MGEDGPKTDSGKFSNQDERNAEFLNSMYKLMNSKSAKTSAILATIALAIYLRNTIP